MAHLHPHFGSSMLLINGDRSSPAYGRVLVVRERGSLGKPHLAGVYSPPGGSREKSEDFIMTAIRETAEEATNGDAESVAAVVQALYDPARCRLDLFNSHKVVLKPGPPPRVIGKLFAVLWDGSVFPGMSAELPTNRDTSQRIWMSIKEISQLGNGYRFIDQFAEDIAVIKRVARHHDVVLA